MKAQGNSRRNALVAGALLLAAVFAGSSLMRAQSAGGSRSALKSSSRDDGKTAFEAWKENHRASAGRRRGIQGAVIPPGGNPAVARPSMVINTAGSVLYSKHFAGNACDPDPGEAQPWRPATAYALNDETRPFAGSSSFYFRATNAGTSGASEPVWPLTFGTTVVDGTITWQAVDRNWTANRAYPLGTVVGPPSGHIGFNFRAIQAGTTGATEPSWPIVIGGTVNDGTVIWQAIAFRPGSFVGCTPMQLILRASGGAETILTSEGAPVGGAGAQVGGWAEFYAMNSSGQAAFRPVIEGRVSDGDETGTGVFLAGPGAGALTEVAASNTIVAGRDVCGFGPMVAINDAGQVLFDAYVPNIQTWQPSTAYSLPTRVVPTVYNGFDFVLQTAGTSGPTEPVWPLRRNATVNDGTAVWRAEIRRCDENAHGMMRFTPGPGNELLMAVGTSVGGGVTVVGFGNDVVGPNFTCVGGCAYEDIDGYLTPGGHASVAVRLSNGDTAAYLLTGPLAFTQVARTGTAGPGGTFGRIYPRTEVNAADQVLFKAQVSAVDKLIRWTGPSTFLAVASVGDDVGTRSGGAASGVTLTALGFFGDINASGNVVFQATLSSGPRSYFFWNATTGFITEIAREGPFLAQLASEMVTINDSNVVAFTSGAGAPEQTEEPAEMDEKGFHFWTLGGGVTHFVRNGDIIGGLTVSSVDAQHPSFRKRQLSNAGCSAVRYFVNGVTGGGTEDASEGSGTRNAGVPPAGQLLVGCAGIVLPPTATPTVTGTPPPTSTSTPTPTVTTAGGGPAGPPNTIPTLSETMLALFGLALAAAATFVLLTRKR